MDKKIKVWAVYSVHNELYKELEYYFFNKTDAYNYVKEYRDNPTQWEIKEEELNLKNFYVTSFNSFDFGGWVPLPDYYNVGVWHKSQHIKKLNPSWCVQKKNDFTYVGVPLKLSNLLEYENNFYYKTTDQKEKDDIVSGEGLYSDISFQEKTKTDFFSKTKNLADILLSNFEKAEKATEITLTVKQMYNNITSKISSKKSFEEYENVIRQFYEDLKKNKNISKSIIPSTLELLILAGIKDVCADFKEAEVFASLMAKYIVQ